MVIKFFTGALLVFFLAACSTTPKDTADSSGSGSSTASSDASSAEEGTIIETSPDSVSIQPGSQEDLIVNVGDRVYFNYDSSDLDDEDRAILNSQSKFLNQNQSLKVTIQGHCDERGTREYNLALGEKRASSVKDYLISLGINSERISVVSYGKERPQVLGSNKTAWSMNRRSVTTID